MGRFDDGRQREAEREAYLQLWNLWFSRRAGSNVDNWESACECCGPTTPWLEPGRTPKFAR